MNLLFEFRCKGTTFFLDTQTQISQISTIFEEKSKKKAIIRQQRFSEKTENIYRHKPTIQFAEFTIIKIWFFDYVYF